MNEELKIIIRAELAQFKKAMSDAVSGLKQVANEGRKASKDIDGFTGELNQQAKALSALKQDYINLAAAHGKESQAAKDAADAIKKLSAEYKTNKALATDLANEANSFDVSLGGEEASKNVDKTNESVQDLQGTMEAIRNLDFAGVLLSAFGPEVRAYIESAKASFSEASAYFTQFFQNFNKNSDLYADIGGWEGWGEAIKGAGESAKLTFQSLKDGFTQFGKAAGSALGGIVGVLLVVIADLAILIGLIKNALSVAKEVKTMAAEASKIGLETDTYGEWGYVLKQVGIETDKLSDFLKTLTEEQNAVRDGSEEMIEAFGKIGLSQEEVMGSSQEELFRKTVEGLQNVENAAERTSLAYRIFGEDAADLTNILYLTNQETRSLVDNYYALGGAPSDNLIQKSKELGGSTTNLSYAWQGLRNTLAEWVIPAVIAVVQWLTTAVAYINVFLQGIFGVKAQTKDAAKGMENISAGVGKVGTGAKQATAAVKELLRYTMGFDELNIIPKQSSPSGSGSSGSSGSAGGGFSGSGISADLPVIEVPDMTKFREFMAEYGSIIQGILTWSLIGIGVLLAVLGFMHGNIAMGILGISMAGLGIGIGAAGGSESHWSKLGQAIMDVLSAVGQFFVDVWNLHMSIMSGIASWINTNVIVPVVNFLKGLWAKIVEIFTPVVEWFSELFSNVAATFTTTFEVIVGLFKGNWIMIKTIWGVVASWFDSTVIQPLSGFFSGMWEGVKTAASGAWEGIKSVFSVVGKWFKDTFTTAWEGVKAVFSTGGKIFMGIVDGIATTFKVVVNAIITGINRVVAVPFNTVNGILNFIRGINIAGIKPFDGLWGYNPLAVPQIPQLATGGIVMNETLARIGEGGKKEAVLPLEQNTGWMDVLADRIASRSNTPTKIVLNVDGNELGWANIHSINRITQQTGGLQLNII